MLQARSVARDCRVTESADRRPRLPDERGPWCVGGWWKASTCLGGVWGRILGGLAVVEAARLEAPRDDSGDAG